MLEKSKQELPLLNEEIDKLELTLQNSKQCVMQCKWKKSYCDCYGFPIYQKYGCNRKEQTGRKPSNEKQIIIDKLKKIYKKHYLPLLTDDDIISDDKLSYILKNYECVDIVKNINNNIKEHFVDHVRKYINYYFIP